MTKKIYKVSGMHCSTCAVIIEGDLEDAGVKAKCHYARMALEVEYDPEKISEKKIKEVVSQSGYAISSP